MVQPYRIAIRHKRGKRLGYLLLVAGALCLYLASLPQGGMRVEAAKGVLVTREETLAQRQFFIVSLYDSADETSALVESARFSPRGGSGAVIRIGGIFHAAGAVFMQEEDATDAAEALLADGIPAKVARITAPQALVRITASQKQIEALLLADEALFEAIKELGAIAARIDGGGIDLQGAQGLLHAQACRIQAVCDETAVCPENEETVKMLRGQLFRARDQMSALSEVQSVSRLALSSTVRCLQMHMIDAFSAYRCTLSQ